jgi:hypothetical protein
LSFRQGQAIDNILGAADILDELPPVALEQIRDFCTDYIKGRKSTFSEFKHAYINMVCEHLKDARLCEQRLYTGITGKSA